MSQWKDEVCSRCEFFVQTKQNGQPEGGGECRFTVPQVVAFPVTVQVPGGMENGKPVMRRQQGMQTSSAYPPREKDAPACSSWRKLVPMSLDSDILVDPPAYPDAMERIWLAS